MNKLIIYDDVGNIPLYNCSEMTTDEWIEKDGEKRPLYGIISIIYGIAIEIIYALCMLAMSSKEFIRLSCYKIMFLLGCIDMLGIAINSILTGFLLIEGAVFCSYPLLIYCAGAFGLGAWCSSCVVCLALVINRVFALIHPKMVKLCFEGYRTYFVMAFPILYGLYFVIFTRPVIFTSKYQFWFFDPFFPINAEMCNNNSHTANNFIVVFATLFLYVYLCIALYLKVKRTTPDKSKRINKSILTQAIVIGLINMLGSIVYCAMQVIVVPEWFIILGQLEWQLAHGFPAIIYITMNPTIRKEIIKILHLNKKTAVSSSLTPFTIPNNNQVNNDIQIMKYGESAK